MVRRRTRLSACLATIFLLALTLLTAPPGPAGAAGTTGSAAVPRADDEYDAPLEVTIDELTPGLLPTSGPLVVRGTVTNVDLETWERINLYPMFGSGAPAMTTEDELVAAAQTDPEAQVGVRETGDEAVRARVETLAPGESMPYTIRIPQRVLRKWFPSPAPGVYWFGVHALGESTDGRDQEADGRARTFLPSVQPGGPRVEVAVVLPLRARVANAPDGELGRTTSWDKALSPQGILGGNLAFGEASGGAPLTWLVDPAVPDAVSRLAAGNPTREITPVEPAEQPTDGSATPSDEGDGEDAGEAGDAGAEIDGATLEPDDPLVRAAQTWLEHAQAAFGDHAVAVLPYGDPDLSAAARSLPSLYATARAHASPTLAGWGVEGTPAVAAPNGYLDSAALRRVDDGAVMMLGEAMLASVAAADEGRDPIGGRIGESDVLVTSSGTAHGGPGPDPSLAPVALRQRLLSEAVVRVLRAGDDRPEPLVVVVPSGVDPADARSFWSGLDSDLLRLVDLPALARSNAADAGGTGRDIDPDDLVYPDGQLSAQLDSDVLTAAGRLIRAARSLQGILGEGYSVGDALIGEALSGTSYTMRNDADAASRLDRAGEWVADQLAEVTLDAPQGVTLSSSTGSFNIAVRNGLDHAVTVRIEATTDGDATIRAANPIVLAANSRASVPISADMHGTGVHNVRLRLTDADGTPIGGEDELPIRSGQVGVVLWVIIGTGAGILFVAIGIRLVRRVRRRHDEAPA